MRSGHTCRGQRVWLFELEDWLSNESRPSRRGARDRRKTGLAPTPPCLAASASVLAKSEGTNGPAPIERGVEGSRQDPSRLQSPDSAISGRRPLSGPGAPGRALQAPSGISMESHAGSGAPVVTIAEEEEEKREEPDGMRRMWRRTTAAGTPVEFCSFLRP